ncbi:uncharacterized protein [Temnothorax nylanderi]|uniref:uncharacterized protein isoform X1 n=1 Tax=Temnothorax nylanderi TaxID=102681 RepID=UPI003A8B1F3F
MLDQAQQKDNKRKRDQSPSDSNKRQKKIDQGNSPQFAKVLQGQKNKTDFEEDKPEKSSLKEPKTSSSGNYTMEGDVKHESGEDKSEDSNAKNPEISSPDDRFVKGNVESKSGSREQSSNGEENTKSQQSVGLRKYYHGIAYQVQWMMIVALEAKDRLKGEKKRLEDLKNGIFKFKIIGFETEDPDAGKFDDLVWTCETDQPNSYKYNFLQAKHTLNKEKKIKVLDLLKPKQKKNLSRSNKKDERPFALEKYFLSYRDQIKKNPKYENGKIDKLIIATNIDFDGELKKDFEPQGNIPILYSIEKEIGKKSKHLGFRKGNGHPSKEKVIKHLRRTYDSIKLIEELLRVLKNESVTEEDLLGSYFYDLKENKIIDKSGKFHSDFIENVGLSHQAKIFREFLWELGFKNEKENSSDNFDISEPDISEFAEEIASLITQHDKYGGIKITRHRKIIKDNIDKLANYVLVKDEGNKVRFSKVFWEDEKLPGNLNKLRESLKTKFKEFKLINENDDGSQNEKLKQYYFTITNFATCKEWLINEKTFWKRMKNGDIKNNIEKNLPSNKVLPEISLNDINDEIEEFFKHLTFVVNYSQEELEEFIKIKCSWYAGFEIDYIACEFLVRVANALNLEKKEFISTAEEVDKFFEEAKKQISHLIIVGPTLEYTAKLEEYGIEFEKGSISKLYTDDENRKSNDFFPFNKIFNIVTKFTTLTAIKVYQAIKMINKNEGSYIFVSLFDLKQSIQDHMLKAFDKADLLAIECDSEKNDVENLYENLKDIIKNKFSKTIVLITKQDDPLALANKFETDFSDKYIEKTDEENSLIHLTPESQKKFLNEKKVVFQGKEESLDGLIDESSKCLIDGEVLSKLINNKLINNKKINVGSKVSQKSDSGSPAYNIISEEIKIERFKDVVDDLFVISGIKKEELTNLGITEEKICLFNNRDLNDKKQFFLLITEDHDQNIKDFEIVCHDYPDKTIHLIESKDNKFMWNRYYDPKFYTNRKFNQIEIDAGKLREYVTKKDEDKKVIFVVNDITNDITKEEFKQRHKIDKNEIALSTDGNIDGNKPIVMLNDADKEKSFSDLSDSKKLENFDIHWLESKKTTSSCLVWKRSKGKTSELSNLIVSKTADGLDSYLTNFDKDARFAAVIADLPGMGKSVTLTLLSEFYKGQNKLNWVIRVNLRDYRSEIDKLPGEYNKNDNKNDFKEIVKFFSEIDKKGLEDKFSKNLFEHRLKNKNKNNILLLFDGFDEISSDQKEGDTRQSADKQEKITNLLKFLKDETEARIVVTTRPYKTQKTSLEDALSVLSYTFKPIENERQEFLKNFWKRSLKLKYSKNEIEPRYEEFAKDLIGKFNKIVNEEKLTFMGIPLHLRMLAEIYLKNFGESQLNDDFKNLNIFNLYKEFVDRKYKIYFSEKTGLFSTSVTKAHLDIFKESYEKMHKRLAFKYLFSRSTEPYFKLFFFAESEESSFIKNKMPNEEKTLALNRIGITQSSKDDIDFIHRTFAEYFVSKLIYERLKQKLENPNYSEESKNKMREFLLNHIFIENENNVIRSFIDSELADGLENFWSGQNDSNASFSNEEPLIVAVKNRLGNIFTFLLRSEKDKEINKKLINIPKKRIEELCNNGKYTEASLLSKNASEFLIKELGKNHLEVAIMQRYQSNAYGDLAEGTKDKKDKKSLFEKRQRLLEEEVVPTFKEHLKAAEGKDTNHQEDYFQQALSTFKEYLKSIEAQKKCAKDLDDNQRNVWIMVLEIEIAKAERNLSNTYGDLAEFEGDQEKKKLFEKKKELLEEKVLPTFDKYLKNKEIAIEQRHKEQFKVHVAETKKNLGNAYGDLNDCQNKKKLLTEALEIFDKCLEDATANRDEEFIKSLKVDIAKTKRNLGNACGKLGDYVGRRRFLEEALPDLKEHYGLLHPTVTKAQGNLGKAYKKLEYRLHGAVISGDENEVVKQLVDYNVNETYNGYTPLYLAAREGHVDIVQKLLEKQPDPNIPLPQGKFTSGKNSQIYQKIIEIIENYRKNYRQECTR